MKIKQICGIVIRKRQTDNSTEQVRVHASQSMFGSGKFRDRKPLPNDRPLDWFKLKTFAEDNLKVIGMIIYVLDRVENIVGNGEIADLQHTSIFSSSHNVFKKLFCPRSLKIGISW